MTLIGQKRVRSPSPESPSKRAAMEDARRQCAALVQHAPDVHSALAAQRLLRDNRQGLPLVEVIELPRQRAAAAVFMGALHEASKLEKLEIPLFAPPQAALNLDEHCPALREVYLGIDSPHGVAAFVAGLPDNVQTMCLNCWPVEASGDAPEWDSFATCLLPALPRRLQDLQLEYAHHSLFDSDEILPRSLKRLTILSDLQHHLSTIEKFIGQLDQQPDLQELALNLSIDLATDVQTDSPDFGHKVLMRLPKTLTNFETWAHVLNSANPGDIVQGSLHLTQLCELRISYIENPAMLRAINALCTSPHLPLRRINLDLRFGSLAEDKLALPLGLQHLTLTLTGPWSRPALWLQIKLPELPSSLQSVTVLAEIEAATANDLNRLSQMIEGRAPNGCKVDVSHSE